LVGGAERSEFLRQNALLANIWTGLGAETSSAEEPDRTISTSLTDSSIRPIP
jgi:arylformamidase